MTRLGSRRLGQVVARGLLYAAGSVLVLAGVAFFLIQTDWAKDELRGFLVRQANQYLTATLEIGRLEGSLIGGVQLGEVRLSRGSAAIVTIDEVSLAYSIRELFATGTFIRRLRLVRPQVVARQDDAKWNVASLLRREAPANESRGTARRISIRSIEVVDGDVTLRDPLTFGAVRVPSRFSRLNALFSLEYESAGLRLRFAEMSWEGDDANLTVNRLTGEIARGPAGWSFDDLAVETPRSAFVLEGRTVRGDRLTTLDLRTRAERFSFEEWGVVLSALGNIAIDATFDVHLEGPLTDLATDLALQSNGGAIEGTVVLDTTVPGWHGAGSLRLASLDLAPWLNRVDRPSDISGEVRFDLALEFGRGFPLGSYAFEGPHAAFLQYEADNVRARGTITPSEVRIAQATATAYAARVRVANGSIGIGAPYPLHVVGSAAGVDLRRLPLTVPVPHVESALAFTYDVRGAFGSPFIAGEARFATSEFVGATIGDGAVGTIDTSAVPLDYGGEGDVSGVDLHRFGQALGVAWLQEPRVAGTLSGHFSVEGSGREAPSMTLSASGRLDRGAFFNGVLSEATVSLGIANGSLEASYAGHFSTVNPAIVLGDPRVDASLSGNGRARFGVRNLLLETKELADYAIDASLSFESSTVGGVSFDTGAITAALTDRRLVVANVQLSGPRLDVRGAGTVALDLGESSRFDYVVSRADLSLVTDYTGWEAAGELSTTGRLTGLADALRLVGEAAIEHLDMAGVRAASVSGQYDTETSLTGATDLTASVEGEASSIDAFDQAFERVAGTVRYGSDWPARCFIPVRMRVYITADGTDLDSDGGGIARR